MTVVKSSSSFVVCKSFGGTDDEHLTKIMGIGTMSLNELAVDLTCEPVEFEPASSTVADDHSSDAKVPFPESGWGHGRRRSSFLPSTAQRPRYHVHGGMLRMARVMGEIGKPVHLAVMDALSRNPDYGS